MSKYPRNPELMKTRAERFKTMPDIAWRIDAILALECKTVLKAYYGGYWRAGWHLIWESVFFGIHGAYWTLVFRISDFIGWTKLIPMEPGSEFKIRHGPNCSPNCRDLGCHRGAIPMWYQKLTRMKDVEDE